MATKRKPTKKTSADKLTKATKKGEVELKDEELKRVTGGSFSWGAKDS
jgi:natural product precursor